MPRFSIFLSTILGTFFANAAFADPDQVSCRFLEVLGANKTADVSNLMEDAAANWLEPARETAVESLTTLLGRVRFEGGNIYRVTALGADLTEDLVLVRLATGEVHGLLLTYNWAPEGTRLVGLDYKAKIEQLTPLALTPPAQPIACPE